MKTIKFYVVGATRPEVVEPGQTSFVTIMTSKSGHCYQTLTSKLHALDDVLEFEVNTATGAVSWTPEVLFARKLGRPAKHLLEVLK